MIRPVKNYNINFIHVYYYTFISCPVYQHRLNLLTGGDSGMQLPFLAIFGGGFSNSINLFISLDTTFKF